ncbi:MAG: von Willebrand factor type [Panacagrimonas sp.]|nr:VIT domain-containing protein [Panacagrimonas sp.]MCC2655747.1 von Willebrand factor type [Panacagrimonas sp.]
MNTAALARVPSLKTAAGQTVPLQSLDIRGHLESALARVELVQSFRNREEIDVEAVYTFPLPVEAVLLGLSVDIDGRTLVGHVAPRQQAEAQYEQALSDGHTAVMLEQLEPGLYTLNLGNLMAGESAEIVLRYALPLRWEGDRLRLSLPTTLAPRYGDAALDGVQPHQVPDVDPLAEYPFRLTLCVADEVEASMLSSPTHRIRATRDEAGLNVQIADDAGFADRDFVLVVQAEAKSQSGYTLARDGERSTAHAVFRVPDRRADQRIRLKVLIDCSGSMAGDSMALAKALAMRALDRLGTSDAFSLTAFGSTHRHLGRGRLLDAGSGAALVEGRSFVGALDADLGGTEMLGALNAVFALGRSRGAEGDADVLLITDGETWDREAIVQAARASGHRIFVIGVGCSPSEVLARGIAQATGGFATFVAPNEEAAPVIDRHLDRMRLPRVRQARLHLPGRVQWSSPTRLETATFAGDTLHVFAGIDGAAQAGDAHLDLHYADGAVVSVAASRRAPASDDVIADLPRIAAAQRLWWAAASLVDASESELTDLAVHHQLMSPYTNYILVHERGDRAAADLPELRKVPGMLAAGWGGTGSALAAKASVPVMVASMVMSPSVSDCCDAPAPPAKQRSSNFFETRVTEYRTGGQPEWNPSRSPAELLAHLDACLTSSADALPLRIDELDERGVAGVVVLGLKALVEEGRDETSVMLAFWQALLDSPLGALLHRAARRAVSIARKGRVMAELDTILAGAIHEIRPERWAWSHTTAVSTAP